MNRFGPLVIFLSLVGCEGSTPTPKRPMVNPLVQTIPGPSDPDAPKEFTTTESGLKYRILRKTYGKKPTENDATRVHFRCSLENGTINDSTYGQTGESRVLPMRGTPKGWSEGLQLIGEGGMIELEVPPSLGFGNGGQPGLPKDATIHFIVEIIEVLEARKQ